MSQNVAEALEGRASNLFEKLSENQDLANVVMGFLGRIIMMCHQQGKPIQGVDCSEVTTFDGDFRFSLTFNDLLISPMGLWQPTGDLISYAKSRSVHLAKALESNGKLVKTLSRLVEIIERHCESRGKQFKNFQIKKAFIHPKTNTCVIRSGAPELKDRFR
jgi:hypothetical protein